MNTRKAASDSRGKLLTQSSELTKLTEIAHNVLSAFGLTSDSVQTYNDGTIDVTLLLIEDWVLYCNEEQIEGSSKSKIYEFPTLGQRSVLRMGRELRAARLNQRQLRIVATTLSNIALEWFRKEASSITSPSRVIESGTTRTDDASMADEDDRIITKKGSRYFPISLAAQLAQVPRTTLLNWVNAKIKFQDRPLQVYQSRTARKSFLSEDSIQRVANRFVKWPSEEPAGAVRLGESFDQNSYVGISKAARALGIDHHTMWLWTTHGTAPTGRPLDVIKCTASDQFYIYQKDIVQLKKLIPRSGLRRGRRPQPTAS